MKRLTLILAAALLTFTGALAQNVDDALRYSQIFYTGTARFMSMGGAFTALGGDMSTLSQNPAGLGVFRSSEISLSPQLFHSRTSANFNGISDDYLYNFNLGQAGIVSNVISGNGTSGLVSLNIGYSFNKTNNLHSSARIQGKNLTGAAGIAYDAWIIDTITGTGAKTYGTVFSNYGDNASSDYGQNVRRLISNEGYTGEHAFSIGGNYSNKIFFGATLGISRLRYTGHYEHLEKADYFLDSDFGDFTYVEHFENTGTGVSLKIGTIIKPTDQIRIGFAFHSPTLYRINERFYDNITSNFSDGGHYEFENNEVTYNYALTTPFRALAGVAYQFKKIALLSVDYEFVDYSTIRFSETGDNYDYSEKNLEIKNTLKPASNVRLGGEFRFNKMYFRGGYGYYGKVFKTGELNEDMFNRSISFGTGFREQNLNIDFAFTNLRNEQNYILYNTSSETVMANLTNSRNIFTVTLGYKFGY
ncbi:MAG: outer membrane protein transport protein [Bacteroidia bacterium]|nr:outer membrane protein transport protein [Bacteroidia bacterium]